jgi:hypothetical protein
VLQQAPKIAHFWIHGFLHRSFVKHRLDWLRRKGTRFGRGEGGVKVHQVNEGPAQGGERDVIYRVHPRNQKPTSVADAVRGLNEMNAEAFAGSLVLKVHEFGEDIRTPGLMSIPVKTRPKSPAKWIARNPGKRLIYRPSKKVPGDGLLYEVTKTRSRGRPKKGSVPARDKMRLRFLLKRFVEMDPTLHMYRTWDELSEDRSKLWAGAADRMIQQLQQGDPRDF